MDLRKPSERESMLTVETYIGVDVIYVGTLILELQFSVQIVLNSTLLIPTFKVIQFRFRF